MEQVIDVNDLNQQQMDVSDEEMPQNPMSFPPVDVKVVVSRSAPFVGWKMDDRIGVDSLSWLCRVH
jgi:hypothetical protein